MTRSLSSKLSLTALFIALSLIFAYVEAIIPLELFIPVPGFKLGLSNVPVCAAAIFLGVKFAFPVLLCKISVTALLFGTVTSFYFSLCGGLLSFSIIALYCLVMHRYCGIIGMSVLCAAFHNIGQCLAATVLFGPYVIFSYLPILLAVSILTGALTALILFGAFTRLSHLIKIS